MSCYTITIVSRSFSHCQHSIIIGGRHISCKWFHADVHFSTETDSSEPEQDKNWFACPYVFKFYTKPVSFHI